MFILKPDSQELINIINTLNIKDNDVLLIMVSEKNKNTVPEIISTLNTMKVDFFGGIFPSLIYNNKKIDEGAVITVLPALVKPFLITGLDKENIEIPDFSELIINTPNLKQTVIILVDGLTSNISLFLSNIYNKLGNSVNYIGGGAGALTLKQEECVFTSEGYFKDAAIITFINLESSLGVRHGWESFSDSFVATKTKNNIISELNWKNAYNVYKQVVEMDSGKIITKENFFSISKGYCFGILKEDREYIVRDPIAVNDAGELICVGEIPENSVLCILKGSTPSLIASAEKASDDCLETNREVIYQVLIFDCISRVLFLEEEFNQELEVINKKFVPLKSKYESIGALSLGEISSYGDGFLEFFNKTLVISMLYEK